MPDVTWTEALETYIKSCGEQALCLSVLHRDAGIALQSKATPLDISIIILSTLTGSASLGSQSLFGDAGTASIGIGLVSILVALLGSVNTYFSFGKKSEAHRIASLAWSKLGRGIEVAMTLPREERDAPGMMIRSIQDTMTRLTESSPALPPQVITAFKSRFASAALDISRPLETNGLHRIVVFTPTETDDRSAFSAPDVPLPTIKIDG
jgi:hypothetical protein